MKLFIPGPIWCREDALQELSHQPLGHRSSQFTELYKDTIAKLKQVLGTQGDVHISTSSGSGIWELAVRNCVRKRALVCDCGAFSQKWGKVAQMNGRETVELLLPIALTLRSAHELDILHRDIKPSNILLERTGRSVLLDFGIALMRDREAPATEYGTIKGKPAYM